MAQEPTTVRLLAGKPQEMRELQRVLEEAPTYAHRITGVPPGRADGQSTYSMLPEGKSYEDKFVFGIYRGGEMVGCADLIRGYPKPATAMLGLLLLAERHQRQGIGRRAYFLLEDFIRGWATCDQVRIAVIGSNKEVVPFWTKLGFTPTGEVKPYRYGAVESQIVVLQKPLPVVREARAEDADAAVEVLRRSITELCTADHHGDAGTLSAWLANKTPQNFRSWLADAGHFCVVAEEGDRLLGVGLLHRSGELRLCYLAPGAQGRGIGKAIYRTLEAKAKHWQLPNLRLESTVSARPFYESLGYRPAGAAKPGFGISHCHPYEKLL